MPQYHVIELPELNVGHGLPKRVGELWLTGLTKRHPHLEQERADLQRLLQPAARTDARGVASVLMHVPVHVPEDEVLGLARELSDWYPSVNLHSGVTSDTSGRPVPEGETHLRAVLIDGVDILASPSGQEDAGT